MNTPRLTDGVVVLDGHTLADSGAHLAGEDDEQARRFGWYPTRSTAEGVRSAIGEWREQWATNGATRTFAIRDAETTELVGGCQVRLRKNRIAEMSYWVFPPFRDRRLASRAVSLACGWAFAELGVERMEIYVEPDNAASRGVALRADFTEEGLLRRREPRGDSGSTWFCTHACPPTAHLRRGPDNAAQQAS